MFEKVVVLLGNKHSLCFKPLALECLVIRGSNRAKRRTLEEVFVDDATVVFQDQHDGALSQIQTIRYPRKADSCAHQVCERKRDNVSHTIESSLQAHPSRVGCIHPSSVPDGVRHRLQKRAGSLKAKYRRLTSLKAGMMTSGPGSSWEWDVMMWLDVRSHACYAFQSSKSLSPIVDRVPCPASDPSR